MMNTLTSEPSSVVWSQALARLREQLSQVPFLALGNKVAKPERTSAGDWRPDFSIDLAADGDHWVLICEVKSDGQPRNVRGAALALRDYVQRFASANESAHAYRSRASTSQRHRRTIPRHERRSR